MGGLHAAKLAELQHEGLVRLVGVFDTDGERAHQVADPLGAPRLHSLDEVVSEADAACVAVPTTLHADVATRLLDSGVDVLLEKPMAVDRGDARELIELAQRRGRVLQVGHIERFSRVFREILPVIQRPRFIEVHRLGPYTGRATDASVVLDLMIHDLDLVSLLAGAEVERYEAVGVPVLSSTCDIANARVRFANGCVANLTASRVSAERMRKLRLFQSNAYVSIDFGTNAVTVMRREGLPGGAEPPKIHAQQLELDEADALLAQDRAFARAVVTRERPEVAGEEGYRALDLALSIEESIPPLEELE
jgi:predicted dehydrogenase